MSKFRSELFTFFFVSHPARMTMELELDIVGLECGIFFFSMREFLTVSCRELRKNLIEVSDDPHSWRRTIMVKLPVRIDDKS